jgi:hypothetical protein
MEVSPLRYLPPELGAVRLPHTFVDRAAGAGTSSLWLLVRVAYRAVARTLEEILKHLVVMEASQVEMPTSLRLDRLVFRENTSVLKGFRPSLQWESNQPIPEYRRVAQSGRISR